MTRPTKSHKERLMVVKIGGAVIDSQAALQDFLADFAKAESARLLIHGGGRAATALCHRLDIPVQMVDGRRITDKASLDVATMVYGGLINKQIVASLQAAGCNAFGLSGADGNAILADRRPVGKVDYGFVGDVKAVNADLIDTLIASGVVPVISPLTHDGGGNILNTNADTIAQSVAEAMARLYDVELIYCFEHAGVLACADDEESLIDSITPSSYERLKAEGIVNGGMIPKLDNAFRALQSGVGRVVIKSAANILDNKGTTILLD